MTRWSSSRYFSASSGGYRSSPVFLPMPPPPGRLEILRGDGEVVQRALHIISRPNILNSHGHEFVARIAVMAKGRLIDRKKPQRLQLEHPHRLRVAFEQ